MMNLMMTHYIMKMRMMLMMSMMMLMMTKMILVKRMVLMMMTNMILRFVMADGWTIHISDNALLIKAQYIYKNRICWRPFFFGGGGLFLVFWMFSRKNNDLMEKKLKPYF